MEQTRRHAWKRSLPSAYLLDAPCTPNTSRPRWKYHQVDWTAFSTAVDHRIREAKPTSIEELSSIIYQAATVSVPLATPSPGRKALPCRNQDRNKKRRKFLRAAKKLTADHELKTESLERYRKQHNKVRQSIRQAKLNSWSNFLDSINSNQTASELWGRMSALNGKKKPAHPILRRNNVTYENPNDTANILGEFFQKISVGEYSKEFHSRNNVDWAPSAGFLSRRIFITMLSTDLFQTMNITLLFEPRKANRLIQTKLDIK